MPETLNTALGNVLDAQAANDEQDLALFNPTPEIDSAIERVATLTHYGVPQERIEPLMAELMDVFRSNRLERDHQRSAAGQIDRELRGERTLGVKSLARAVREHMKTMDKAGPSTAKGQMAERAIRRLCDDHHTKLRLTSFRHELGENPGGRHDQLLDLLGLEAWA